MSMSFVVWSLPPMQSNPSELVNHRNFSNQCCALFGSILFLVFCCSFSSFLSECFFSFSNRASASLIPVILCFAFFALSKYTPALSSSDFFMLMVSSVMVFTAHNRAGPTVCLLFLFLKEK